MGSPYGDAGRQRAETDSMRRLMLLTVVAAAANAAMGALTGANEVGGVDEVDTYPTGLPQDVEPEVLRPPLRPGEERLAPAAPQPPAYQPVYRPPTPVPRPSGQQWRYRTVMSAGHITKNLYDWETERAAFFLKFLFKHNRWDRDVPFDFREEWDGAGFLLAGGSPPGTGRLRDPGGEENEYSGPRGALRLYLADALAVELYAGFLYSENAAGGGGVQEDLVGVKAGLNLEDRLILWYGRQKYTVDMDFFGWDKEWTFYGVDWLFKAGTQHFRLSVFTYDDPEEMYWFMGPFEETKLEISWYPTRQLKLSGGLKFCPDGDDDSKFLSVKWDASRRLSLGFYSELSDGDSHLDVESVTAALRF